MDPNAARLLSLLAGGLNNGFQNPMPAEALGVDNTGMSGGMKGLPSPGTPLPPERPQGPIPQVGDIGPDGGRILAVLGNQQSPQPASTGGPGVLSGIGRDVPGKGQSAWNAFAAGLGSGISNARDADDRAKQLESRSRWENFKLRMLGEDSAWKRQYQERQLDETKRWHDTMGVNYGRQTKEVDPVTRRRQRNLALNSDPDYMDIQKRLEADSKEDLPSKRMKPEERAALEAKRADIIRSYEELDGTPAPAKGGGAMQDTPTPAPKTEGGAATDIQTFTPNAGKSIEQLYPNARKAKDGNYYVPDPDRPGKYLRVDTDEGQK